MINRNLHASLLRFCADFAEQFPGMTALNFDAHADESTIPANDVIGMSGLAFRVQEHMIHTTVMFGLSTVEDTNLFRLTAQMDALFELLLPTKRIRVYDADSGADVGWMVVEDGTSVMPVSGSTTRPLQYVLVSLSTSLSFHLG